MKIKILRIVLVILLLSTFYIIFGFSNQNGEKSGGISQKITKIILERFQGYNNLEEKQKEKVTIRTEKIIRKIAHFSIYSLVGLLLMALLCTYKIKDRWKVLITILLGIIYATSDEIHQGFIPGRSPKITDVYLDTLGVCFGGMLIILTREIYYKYVTKPLQK